MNALVVDIERFAKGFVIDDSGCWLWIKSKGHNGYGQFGMRRRNLRAHRVLYESFYGPVENGLQLDHLCSVRHCVNPKHLEAVTPIENLRRGRSLTHKLEKTHCKRGHEYDEENTRITVDGGRLCRECHRTYNRLAKRKKAEERRTTHSSKMKEVK